LKIASIKGMNDVLPTRTGEDVSFHSGVWTEVEEATRRVFARYSFDEVKTPIVEEAQLFARSVGESTDIVGKEMYVFPERSGSKLLALRPEGTAGSVRAFVEHGLAASDPVQRWAYFGPMFRHERQQKHRYRQFYQLGCEVFGVPAPEQDAEVLALCRDLLRELGLSGIELRLNSLGDANCRPAYLAQLVEYLRAREALLCAECRVRLEKNPLRVLDCKNESCRAATADAPASYEHLCEPCAAHFARVQSAAALLGVEYRLDARLVRGLDYYTRTAFEFLATALGTGQQTAVGGGGRYDALVSLLGGPETPAVGFAMGVERLCALVAQARGIPGRGPALFLAFADEAGRDRALALAGELRRQGVAVEVDLRGGKLQRQLGRADRRGARFSLVLGQAEAQGGRGKLKDMRDGSVAEVELSRLVAELAARAGR
jgi:histidyl-tRNA synthetase